MNKQLKYLFSILILAIFVGGCSLPWQKKAGTGPETDINAAAGESDGVTASGNTGQMKKFSDYQELRNFLEANSAGLIDTAAVLDSDRAADNRNNISLVAASADDNKEADIIKTDGQYIYSIVYNDLFIVKATPASEARAVSKISFNSRPSEIYLDNGRLVVIGNDIQIKESAAYKTFSRQSDYTFVKIFDLTDPVSPKQIRDLDFEGRYLNSRIVDGRLYLAINNFDSYVNNDILTPRLVDNGTILSNNCSDNSNCYAPEVYYFDNDYNSYNFTSLNAIDLKDAKAAVSAQTFLLNGARKIYVSSKNFYIANTQYFNENDLRLAVMRGLFAGSLNAVDRELMDKIDQANNQLLSATEKTQKLLRIFENYIVKQPAEQRTALETQLTAALQTKYEEKAADLERTWIYKFSLSGDRPVYRANGSVSGTVPDQFSLNEDESGDLRLVTARSAGLELAHANLYVLDSSLKQIGTVEKIASGKKIISAGFLGNRAYLIPDAQADPLFVVDLNTANDPKLLGELKVSGLPSYLHFYNEKTLIGFGYDIKADAYGNIKTGGLKLSLLDVTDPANPQELDNYVAGSVGSNSTVFDNHEAFVYNSSKNNLVVPVSLTSTASNFRPYFSGVLVFSINNGQLELNGQIDHSDGGKYQTADSSCGRVCYDSSIKRSLYIQDDLYTFSNKYIKINKLGELNQVQAIKLVPDSTIDAAVESLPAPSALTVPSVSTPFVPDGASVETVVVPGVSENPIGPALPPVPAENLDYTNIDPPKETPVMEGI